MAGIFSDWKTVDFIHDVIFFPIYADNLFKNKEKSKAIRERLSKRVYLTEIKVNGFEDQKWEYWSTPNGTSPCDACTYEINDTVIAERFYGGFSTRLESVESNLHITIDDQKRRCKLVALALRKDSVAHQTAGGKDKVEEDLNFFRLFFDFAFIRSPDIGLEIKNWTVVNDWPFRTASLIHSVLISLTLS